MHPDAVVEKLAGQIAHAYCCCAALEDPERFHAMVGIIGGYFNLTWEQSIRLAAAVFRKEHAAFQREFEHSEMMTAPRFSLRFDGPDAAQWN
jgi:hypothetical protein